MPEEPRAGIAFLTAALAKGYHGPFVIVTRTAEEFSECLRQPPPGMEWLEVDGLIGNPDVWALAAQGKVMIPLDVVLSDPGTEYSALYRLVDVRIVRPVRVTLPAKPGFMKALRLAASLQIPVRLLPGQSSPEALAELIEAASFYLRDPMVETPVEFFHSLLAVFRQTAGGTIWEFLEQDPATFSRRDSSGAELLPSDFVKTHLTGLLEAGAECATCRWQASCAGYFKQPDPHYSCAGVKELLAMLQSAADEISRDLATHDSPALTSTRPQA